MQFTDSHFHLIHVVSRGIDINTIKLERGLDIGLSADDIYQRIDLIKQVENTYYAIGSGPWDAKDVNTNTTTAEAILKNAIEFKPVCIGEIGIDYYHEDYAKASDQIDLFIKQIEIANKLNLPISVHTRDSIQDVYKTLKENKVIAGGIIHCYSGNTEEAKDFINLGFHLSYAANITYKKNTYLLDSLKITPKDKLLLETDAPYLAPQAFRGKTNTPSYVSYAYEKARDVLNIEIEELKEIVKNNFDNLFSIKN